MGFGNGAAAKAEGNRQSSPSLHSMGQFPRFGQCEVLTAIPPAADPTEMRREGDSSLPRHASRTNKYRKEKPGGAPMRHLVDTLTTYSKIIGSD